MNKYVAMVAGILIGAAFVVGFGALLWYLQDYQPPLPTRVEAASGGPNGQIKHHVYLTLQTFPNSPDLNPQWEAEHHYHLMRVGAPVTDPHDDWVTYGPSTTLQVPAYSEVTMTIYQYDSGITLLNQFYSSIRGTIGNTATIDGKTVTGVAADQVAHTFTIHSTAPEGQPYLFVSVPLPRLPDDDVSAGKDNGFVADPHVITFSFYVTAPGHYVWQCEYPCGNMYNGFGGAMSTNGYMNGTFDVVA